MFGWDTASFFVREYIGIGLRDIFAAALILVGGYLTFVLGTNILWGKALRFLGVCMILLGAANWLIAYGDKEGTQRCQAAANVKGLQDQIQQLTRERDAANLASAQAAEARRKLEEQANEQQAQLGQWETFASTLHVTGRAATADDDNRLCKLLGNAPAGCTPATKAVRRKR